MKKYQDGEWQILGNSVRIIIAPNPLSNCEDSQGNIRDKKHDNCHVKDAPLLHLLLADLVDGLLAELQVVLDVDVLVLDLLDDATLPIEVRICIAHDVYGLVTGALDVVQLLIHAVDILGILQQFLPHVVVVVLTSALALVDVELGSVDIVVKASQELLGLLLDLLRPLLERGNLHIVVGFHVGREVLPFDQHLFQELLSLPHPLLELLLPLLRRLNHRLVVSVIWSYR